MIGATVETDRSFDVDFGLTKIQEEKKLGLMDTAAGAIVPRTLPTAPSCPAVGSQDPTVSNYEYIKCYKSLPIRTAQTDSSPIEVPFSQSRFARLLVKDGELHIHYKSVDGCKVEGWQQLTAYDRSIVKIEAGAVYVRNSEGAWDTRGEAAVRLSTRWRPFLSGAVDVRYTGLSNSQSSSQDSTNAKAEKSGTQTFDPLSSSDGILRADFYLLWHLGKRGVIPSLDESIVGGFGLSTLRGQTDPSGSKSEFSETRKRIFGGFRLTVPRYHVEGLDRISNPRGTLQLLLARDDIWNFADRTLSPSGGKDLRNRFIAEGIFEFLEIGTDNTKTPVKARLYWDTPSNLKGPSDLRLSILVAVNIFKH
jgi:hypothetical protein